MDTARHDKSDQTTMEPTRLLAPLPAGDFIDKPAEIDRFIVRLWPDGTIFFKGPRPRIDEFLALCAEEGLVIEVDHISLCG